MEISQITGAGNFKMFTASRIELKFPMWGIWVSSHFHPRGPEWMRVFSNVRRRTFRLTGSRGKELRRKRSTWGSAANF